MLPSPTDLGLGINGIHVESQRVYCTSLGQGLFASVDISPRTGALIGKPKILASGLLNGGDFALPSGGKKALIANNGYDTITEVNIENMSQSTAADSFLLQTASVLASGIEYHDSMPMYVKASEVVGNDTVGHVVYANARLFHL